jgi:hypothetical protein
MLQASSSLACMLKKYDNDPCSINMSQNAQYKMRVPCDVPLSPLKNYHREMLLKASGVALSCLEHSLHVIMQQIACFFPPSNFQAQHDSLFAHKLASSLSLSSSLTPWSMTQIDRVCRAQQQQ